MSDGFAYLDIIFFAMVAAFIALRLRSVLGRRTGNERRRPSRVEHAGAATSDNVVRMPEATADLEARVDPTSDLADAAARDGLEDIARADRRFNLADFVNGAKAAFAMILECFAKGDRESLRPLLSDQVYTGFDTAIADRERQGHTLQSEIVSMNGAEVVEASLVGNLARIAVRFVTEQVIVMKDAQGHIIDGDPERNDQVIDIWTFERDAYSSDPNWQLVETRTAT
ncbi:MAG: Tim44/TimA family putative adaptor protein [Pseudomonadota bacterium]